MVSKPAWAIIAAARDGGGKVTAAKLAQITDQSQIEEQIAAFAKRGYELTRGARGEIILAKWPRRLFAEEITSELGTEVVGRRAEIHWVTASTNTLARAEAKRGREGTAIFAEEQTGGRGRFGRKWVAPRFSSILFSTALWSRGARVHPDTLALAGAAAVAEAVSQTFGPAARIKWPNDVVVDGRKISGVLVEGLAPEAEGQWLVIGTGVNVNLDMAQMPKELQATAGSISQLVGHEVDRALLARAILRRLDFWWEVLAAGEVARLSEHVRRFSSIMGSFVTVESKGKRYAGRVVDVDAEVGLVLQMGGGATRTFAPGEASLV